MQDKEALFRQFFSTLKPGGLVFITDYCKGDQKHSKAFTDYVSQRGYHLLTGKAMLVTLLIIPDNGTFIGGEYIL
jgi:hypothetical protein